MLKPVGQLSHIDESLHADNLCEPQGFGKLLLEVMRAKDTMEKTDVTNDAPRQMNGETADRGSRCKEPKETSFLPGNPG